MTREKSGILSKEVLAVIEQKTGVEYTLRHTQRVLHKIGFSLVTPRTPYAGTFDSLYQASNHVSKNKEKYKMDII